MEKYFDLIKRSPKSIWKNMNFYDHQNYFDASLQSRFHLLLERASICLRNRNETQNEQL